MENFVIYHYTIDFSYFNSKELETVEESWQYTSIVPFHEMSDRLREVILRSIEIEIMGQKKCPSITIIDYNLENIEFLS